MGREPLPKPFYFGGAGGSYTPCAVQGWIDAGAHGGKLVGHAEKTSELWQNLVRVVHKALEADAHGVDPQIGAPALSMALLLPVGLADIGSFFGGCGRFAETLQHGVLALKDFFHVPLHEENPVAERFRFRIRSPKSARQTCKEWDDDFDGRAFRLLDPRPVRVGE